MDNEVLLKWLAEPRPALVSAVAEGVQAHVSALKSRGIEFYGYALLPGDPYDIHSLVAVTNGEGDIKVAYTDEQYRYYRFCVDEWMRWEHNGFATANALLAQANKDFASKHTKDGAGYNMDEFEIAHSEALLKAVLCGLEAAKSENAFGGAEPFLAVWISNFFHPITGDSVQRLNSKAAAREFMTEFDSDRLGRKLHPPQAWFDDDDNPFEPEEK